MTNETGSILSISVRHLHAVERHAENAYPEECCGFLVGQVEGAGAPEDRRGAGERVQVHRVLPTRNECDDAPEDGYRIAPETVLAARREANRLDLEVVGYYHSHPDRPAEPSPRDRDAAWDGMSYLIVAMQDGTPVETRSWRLRDDGFDEEAVEPVGDPAALSAPVGRPESSGSPSPDGGGGP